MFEQLCANALSNVVWSQKHMLKPISPVNFNATQLNIVVEGNYCIVSNNLTVILKNMHIVCVDVSRGDGQLINPDLEILCRVTPIAF